MRDAWLLLIAPGRSPAMTTRNTPTEHTTTGKEMNTSNTGKPEYICMIAAMKKKYKKSKKKFGNNEKSSNFAKETTNKFNYKITKQ